MNFTPPKIKKAYHGRGATSNPPNRFDPIEYLDEVLDDEGKPLKTKYFRDSTKNIIAYNTSPDVGFDAGINPYRGCEHGCVYCYARPTHEFFGLSSGVDFESIIFVKENAPRLLRAELSKPKWKPQLMGLSGVTDAWQPVERKTLLTRACLEVLLEFRNPVGIVTKNYLVSRDADILSEMARFNGSVVYISVTTLDAQLASKLEPRASTPSRRLEAIRLLAEAGVPVGVNVAPIIPGLTDHELPQILEAASKAGARFAGRIMLRLPYQVKSLFARWLEINYPQRKDKVLHHIQEVRDGKLNDTQFGARMRGSGVIADQIQQMFQVFCRKYGYEQKPPSVSTSEFRGPQERQLRLF